ncbi:MAG: hypothetical protein IJW05_03320 [Lentisphaeria bacterium]|nr:hypothetical protein [Lentisphaeria bacterium]
MRRMTVILILLVTACCAMAQINIVPGAKMPDVEAVWVTSAPQQTPAKNRKNMNIVIFSDINTPGSVQTLRYIESLESKYRRSNAPGWNRKFQLVVPNSKESLEQFLKASGAPSFIGVGADINGKTFRNFVVAQVPHAVIGIDGAIAWLGPAMDLDYVIGSLQDGTFSREKYQQISRMKMEMQTALRSGLPDVAAKTAEKILESVPNDITSIQTVLYSYEIKKQNTKAVLFLESCIAKCGKNAGGIRLMLLDRIIRAGDLSLWQKAVGEAVKNSDSPDDKLNLAAFLVDMSPRFHFPAEQVLELCKQLLNTPGISNDPEFYANVLEISARAEFAVCRIDAAIQYQEKAVSLRKQNKSPYGTRSVQALEYYKKIKILSGAK